MKLAQAIVEGGEGEQPSVHFIRLGPPKCSNRQEELAPTLWLGQPDTLPFGGHSAGTQLAACLLLVPEKSHELAPLNLTDKVCLDDCRQRFGLQLQARQRTQSMQEISSL